MFLKLKNQENCVCNLQIYEYIARRCLPTDVGSSTDAVVQNGFTANATHEIDASTLSGTLFNNPLFCVYNRIVGKPRNVMLPPGKEMTLSLSHLKGKMINPLTWNVGSEKTEQGYTRGYIIKCTGVPLNQSNPTGKHIIEMSAFKVNVLKLVRYKFQLGVDVAGRNFLENEVTSTDSNLHTLFDGDGTVQDDRQA